MLKSVNDYIHDDSWDNMSKVDQLVAYVHDILQGTSYFIQGNHGEIHIHNAVWIKDKNMSHKIIPFLEVGQKLLANFSYTRHKDFYVGYKSLVDLGLTDYPIPFSNH